MLVRDGSVALPSCVLVTEGDFRGRVPETVHYLPDRCSRVSGPGCAGTPQVMEARSTYTSGALAGTPRSMPQTCGTFAIRLGRRWLR